MDRFKFLFENIIENFTKRMLNYTAKGGSMSAQSFGAISIFLLITFNISI